MLTGLERSHGRVRLVAAYGGARGGVAGEVGDAERVAGSEEGLGIGREGGDCEGGEGGETHCCIWWGVEVGGLEVFFCQRERGWLVWCRPLWDGGGGLEVFLSGGRMVCLVFCPLLLVSESS